MRRHDYCFFDTISLNPSAGGVLDFSELLFKSLQTIPNSKNWSTSSNLLNAKKFGTAVSRLGRFTAESYLARTISDNVRCIFPNYYLPFGLSSSAASRSIVVVHDLQHKFYPENFSALKRHWLDIAFTRAHKHAGAIVCISEATKNDFVKFYGNRANLETIYNPVEPMPALSKSTKERYLIASAHYYPHKNFDGLLQFFDRLLEHGYNGNLVLTGSGSDLVLDKINSLSPPTRSRVKHVGFVSRDKLVSLQIGADACISLSKFEGFNLPAAQCSSSRTRLLLSDLPVHRELFPHALFIPIDWNKSDVLAAYHLLNKIDSEPVFWSKAELCSPSHVATQYQSLLDSL